MCICTPFCACANTQNLCVQTQMKLTYVRSAIFPVESAHAHYSGAEGSAL